MSRAIQVSSSLLRLSKSKAIKANHFLSLFFEFNFFVFIGIYIVKVSGTVTIGVSKLART